MSLVSDALEKAEREAAAREAQKAGLPVPLETPVQPYRARRGQRGARGATVALAAIAALAILLALAFYATRSPSEGNAPHKGATAATSAPPSPAEAPSPSVPTAASEARPAIEPPAPPSARETTSAGAPPSSPEIAPSERPAPPSEREPTNADAPSPLPESTPKEQPAPPSESETKAPSRENQKEFVRRVDFPNGSKLELGGIAYSESAPFAYLNGRLLKIGVGIAGYTLVAIERDRVVVRGAAGELTLRLKPR